MDERSDLVTVELHAKIVRRVFHCLVIEHGDIGSGADVLIHEDPVIHVVDDVGCGQDDVIRDGTLQVDEIVFQVAQHEARFRTGDAEQGTGQDKEPAVFSVQGPFFAGSDMVDDGAVFIGSDETHGGDAGVHHVREREVDQPVSASERKGGNGPFLRQTAQIIGLVICGNDADHAFH